MRPAHPQQDVTSLPLEGPPPPRDGFAPGARTGASDEPPLAPREQRVPPCHSGALSRIIRQGDQHHLPRGAGGLNRRVGGSSLREREALPTSGTSRLGAAPPMPRNMKLTSGQDLVRSGA